MATYTEAQAKQIIDRALARAKGAEAAITLSSVAAGTTRCAVNEITSSADVERATLSVTLQFGKRSATATTNQFDDKSLDTVVAMARRMAKLAPENPEAMPPLGRQTYKRTPGASDPATV